jgi:hypothetical protein
MTVFDLPIEALRAVAVHVANEKEDRYWLRGVHLKLDPQNSAAFACDGSTGAAVSLPGLMDMREPIEMILPAYAIPMTGPINYLQLEVLEKIKPGVYKIEVRSAKTAPFTLETIDAVYPDWKRLFKSANAKPRGSGNSDLIPFDPEKLVKFVKSAKMLGYSKNPGQHLRISRRDTTALISIADRHDFIGICEGIKLKDPESVAIPFWAMA